MKKHKRIHTGEKPLCNKSFAESGQLKRHKGIPTGEKPFSCSKCDMAFITNKNLKTHDATHAGEKPFTCPKCDKTFSQCGHLNYMRLPTKVTCHFHVPNIENLMYTILLLVKNLQKKYSRLRDSKVFSQELKLHTEKKHFTSFILARVRQKVWVIFVMNKSTLVTNLRLAWSVTRCLIKLF